MVGSASTVLQFCHFAFYLIPYFARVWNNVPCFSQHSFRRLSSHCLDSCYPQIPSSSPYPSVPLSLCDPKDSWRSGWTNQRMLLEERRGSVTIWKGGISDESSWVPSKSSKADLMDLVRAGLLPSKEMICWRTVGADLDPSVWLSETALFVPFVRRGLALPACNFLLGLLYYYGIELHNFDPEAILHISIFVYFC